MVPLAASHIASLRLNFSFWNNCFSKILEAFCFLPTFGGVVLLMLLHAVNF